MLQISEMNLNYAGSRVQCAHYGSVRGVGTEATPVESDQLVNASYLLDRLRRDLVTTYW